MAIKTHDFYYELPPELIAQTPIQRRDASRLLTLDKRTGGSDTIIFGFASISSARGLFGPQRFLVLPARLLGRREPTGEPARWCFSLTGEKMSGSVWSGLEKTAGGGEAVFRGWRPDRRGDRCVGRGNRLIRFTYEGIFLELLERLGKMPLPPYIKEELQDAERYQTVYSQGGWLCGSPYGGLHFTKDLLDSIEKMGVKSAM